MRLIQLLILAVLAFACTTEPAEIGYYERSGKSEQAAVTPCTIDTQTAYACQPQYGRPATSFKVRAINLGTVSCSYYVSSDVYSKPLTSPPTVIAATPVIGPFTLAPGATRAHTQSLSITGPMYWDVNYRYRPSGTNSTPLDWYTGTGGPLTGPPTPPITCSDFPPI
jgi:hypothetical protein